VQDRTGSIHLQKLKGLLAEQEPSVKNQKERRVQIDKLMVQLRNRKKLGWVRDKTGQTLSVPKDIAKALNEHWTGVTTPPQPLRRSVRRTSNPSIFLIIYLSMAKLLFRPLSRELVKDALDRLNKQSAPGKDGFSTNIYLAFQDQFVDHMHDLVQEAFREGKLPNGWELGLINCIPKTAGPAAIDKLRPIALQDIKKKWFMTIVMCMVEDVITHMTHPQQVGCIKGRKMIRHIWGAKGVMTTCPLAS
jgi:hypothetical protein